MMMFGGCNLSCFFCWVMGMLLKMIVVVMLFKNVEKRLNSCEIWYVSSRVWYIIIVLILFGIGLSCCKIVMMNMVVFFILDFVWYSMFMLRMVCGMYSCCIVNRVC